MIDSSNAHSSNHVIKKSICLCIDPKDFNEALEREPYYSRSIDELISMFAGAKVFTIVDMDKGYWQVVLHPESRKLTCMAFDIGRYQFKRLPMGSKVASDIFQRMLDSVYIGLPGVTGIADDMVIFGRNCCDMGQNDTIGKIELKPSIVLSSDNTDCKNDIQLFHQLFDELSVHTDYH